MARKMISRYSLYTANRNGQIMLGFRGWDVKDINTNDLAWIKAHKQEIIDTLNADAAEESARIAATVSIVVMRDYSPTTVTIDTRKPLDEQLAMWAKYLDTDIETVRAGYDRHMERTAAAAERVAESHKQEADALEMAAQTGTQVAIRSWMDACDQGDCSADKVTLWAMPDGTTKTTRIHTY